jgi:hypothetical protein
MDPVSILHFLTVVSQTTRTYLGLRTVVVGGDLASALKGVGDSHMQAARVALLHCKDSNNPDREIASAITSLREAYEIFAQSKGKYKDRDRYQTALLIAICYSVLKDKNLTLRFLEMAKEDFGRLKSVRTFWLRRNRLEEEEKILIGVVENCSTFHTFLGPSLDWAPSRLIEK